MLENLPTGCDVPTELPTDSDGYLTPKPVVRFSGREWLLLAALAAVFAVPSFGFDFNLLIGELRLPGIGMAVTLLGFIAAGALYLGKNPAADRLAWALIAFGALLSAAFAVYANPYMRWLNLFWIAATLPAGLSLRAGGWGEGPAKLFEGWGRAVRASVRRWGDPFRAAGEAARHRGTRARGALVGLLVALPALLLVVALLSSADAVFGDVIASALSSAFRGAPVDVLARALLLLALLLFAFSCVRGLPAAPDARRSRRKLQAPAMAVRLPLLLLNLIYALFVYIQFRHLFGGAQAAAMTGGYAEYARSGFFQLSFLAAFNLLAFCTCRALSPDDRPVRALLAVLLAATAVVLLSSAWRMRLYVEEYGLSFLRMLTFWGMAAVALALIAAGWKLARPSRHVFRALFVAWMLTWLVFNAANVDAVIANHNASRYLSGALKRVDVQYLSSLSSGALGALEALRDADVPGAAEAAADMERRVAADRPWVEWSIQK